MGPIAKLFRRGRKPAEEDGGLGGAAYEEGDAFDPTPVHQEILTRVRRDAEADAIRHAEDMLNRDFPILEEAEGIASSRLARLRTAYIERRSSIEGAIASLRTEAAALEVSLAHKDAVLAEEGVSGNRVVLPPLRGPRDVGSRSVVGVGGIVALCLGAILAGLEGRPALAVVGFGAVVLAVVLTAWPGPALENPTVTALRRTRTADAEALEVLRGSLARRDEELSGLKGQTHSVAKNEVAFAQEIVSAYRSAAFSALPVGVLDGDRNFKEQRDLTVRMPAWARELESLA